jgi:hypothetical protein
MQLRHNKTHTKYAKSAVQDFIYLGTLIIYLHIQNMYTFENYDCYTFNMYLCTFDHVFTRTLGAPHAPIHFNKIIPNYKLRIP